MGSLDVAPQPLRAESNLIADVDASSTSSPTTLTTPYSWAPTYIRINAGAPVPQQPDVSGNTGPRLVPKAPSPLSALVPRDCATDPGVVAIAMARSHVSTHRTEAPQALPPHFVVAGSLTLRRDPASMSDAQSARSELSQSIITKG